MEGNASKVPRGLERDLRGRTARIVIVDQAGQVAGSAGVRAEFRVEVRVRRGFADIATLGTTKRDERNEEYA